LALPPLPSPPLFPYTTLFRSQDRLMVLLELVRREDLRHFLEKNFLLVAAKLEYRRKLRERLGGNRLLFEGLKTLLGQLHSLKEEDRKSTRLNSSHVSISYAVF